jgi:predicted RNA-binding Zn-ribbon protein involved in translation (DUF1610 family)
MAIGILMTSRYSKPCPACGTIIRATDIPYGDSFPCPTCGEWLKVESKYIRIIYVVSVLGAIILTWLLGYRDATFIFIATCLALLLCGLGIFFDGIIEAPGFKQIQGKAFDKVPSLFESDKPEKHKKS